MKITATVVEFNGQTQLNEPEIEIIGKVSPTAPLEIVLPADNARLESAEGMLVNFSQSLVVSDYYNYDRYGEMILALPLDGFDRPMQPTAYISPEKAPAEFEKLSSRLIILDDGRMEQNPDPTRHPNANDFNTQNRFRGGDKLQNTIGILSNAYGSYRIQPTAAATYIITNPRLEKAKEVGGTLKVDRFNVLNYFTTFGSRGADNQQEFDRQRAKIVVALANIEADIAGLIEIENNESAIQDLVTALNELLGPNTYNYINTGKIETDEIKVAFIYKPEAESLRGDYAILDSEVDPRFTDNKNRPVLAQNFVEKANQEVFTIAVNILNLKVLLVVKEMMILFRVNAIIRVPRQL